MSTLGRPRGVGGWPIGMRLGCALMAVVLASCARGTSVGLSAAELKATAARMTRAGGLDGAASERGADSATLALARRLDPAAGVDAGGHPEGWPVLDLATAPSLGLVNLAPEDAQKINALLPAALQAPTPAAPFLLRANGPERQRALLCLTQAIYYEAALEPQAGQEAVAQTVVNRVRHPDFPKSICGVVYQGLDKAPACQFSFTCDGSLGRPPIAPFWQRAQAVAARALDGYVMADVGAATAYHADYVFPSWGPTMVKVGQIGQHIFYRFPGPAGMPDILRGRYAGGELRVSLAPPPPPPLPTSALDQASPLLVDTYTAIDPTAPGGVRTRVAGQVIFGRRVPTRAQMAGINEMLTTMGEAAKQAQAPSAAKPEGAAHAEGDAPATGSH